MFPPKLSSICTPWPRFTSFTGVVFQSGRSIWKDGFPITGMARRQQPAKPSRKELNVVATGTSLVSLEMIAKIHADGERLKGHH
jgi:hypothetical protein